MKIFGLEISWGKPSEDKVVVRSMVPRTIPVSQIPTVQIASLSYAQQFSGGRGVFLPAEYDLSEIGKVEDTESICRQAFKKKEGLMFKEGVGVKGANKDTVRYIKARMAQIARASGIPTISLLKRTAKSLIRVSNAFLIKVRKDEASGGKIRETMDGKTLEPIAAYFPAAPETMKADIDAESGKLMGWQQMLPDGRYRLYKPENVIHFVIDRREGFMFGVPTMVPVIDDVRALRQIEENIELLLYQHLFPLFHYKVGTETAPAGYTEEGDNEVDIVEEQIRLMPSEGAIVTPERHDIKAIGSEGRAMRAEGYLTHFKRRVVAGMGISLVDLGEGDTSNRATANTMSRALIDSVKAIQDELEAQWDQEVVNELLLESTFGEDILEEDNLVHLEFAEIDIDNKMEQEKHSLELFKGYGLTYDEYRNALGQEPIPIPEDPEDQDPVKYPEWHNTYWKLIEEPLNLIRAVDEPFSPASQAAAEMRTTALTQKQQQAAGQFQEKTTKQAAEEDRKTKVAITQARSRKQKDHFLATSFNDLESDMSERTRSSIVARGVIDKEYLLSLARVWAGDVADKLNSLAAAELIRGFNDQTNFQSANAEIVLNIGRNAIQERIDYRLNKLAENTINLIKRRVDEQLGDVKLTEAQDDVAYELHVAFDAVRYRTDFIWDVEIRKAYNFGRVLGMRFLGEYGFQLEAHPDGCERCQASDEKIIIASAADIDDVPPFHPNSRMKFKTIIEMPENIAARDGLREVPTQGKKAAIKQEDPAVAAITAVCPGCGNTATWQAKSGNFYCYRCKKAFQDELEELTDGTKLERCVLQVKQ